MGQPGIEQVIKVLTIGGDAVSTGHSGRIDVISLVEIELNILSCFLEGIVHEFKMLGFDIVIVQSMDNQRAGLEIFRMKGIIPLLPDITVVAIMCVLVLVKLVDVVGIVLPNAGPIVLVQHTCANVEGEPRKITIRCIAKLGPLTIEIIIPRGNPSSWNDGL